MFNLICIAAAKTFFSYLIISTIFVKNT